MLKLWKMEDLDDCEVQLQVPEPNPTTCKVSCLYAPPFLTNKQGDKEDNHCFVYIGMENGNIYIFDTYYKHAQTFVNYSIKFNSLNLPGMQANDSDMVNDIKCHMTKMHRMLISYRSTAVVVFSINKNSCI